MNNVLVFEITHAPNNICCVGLEDVLKSWVFGEAFFVFGALKETCQCDTLSTVPSEGSQIDDALILDGDGRSIELSEELLVEEHVDFVDQQNSVW